MNKKQNAMKQQHHCERGENTKAAITLLAGVIPASKHTNSLGNKTNEVLCVILEKKMPAKQK